MVMDQNTATKIAIQINPIDNVAVACEVLEEGDTAGIGETDIVLKETIGLAHKFALNPIQKGEKIIKYGVVIGSATHSIKRGEHVHLHNMQSDYIPTVQRQKDHG